jgi:hypothetical protein
MLFCMPTCWQYGRVSVSCVGISLGTVSRRHYIFICVLNLSLTPNVACHGWAIFGGEGERTQKTSPCQLRRVSSERRASGAYCNRTLHRPRTISARARKRRNSGRGSSERQAVMELAHLGPRLTSRRPESRRRQIGSDPHCSDASC